MYLVGHQPKDIWFQLHVQHRLGNLYQVIVDFVGSTSTTTISKDEELEKENFSNEEWDEFVKEMALNKE